jgi:2-(1,2-epoxy-1,2-dihydrophenyl)acetyl-CoA isomerase
MDDVHVRLTRPFSTSPPVVAAVNGVTAGPGLELALACDVRVAAAHAVFVPAFANAGLVPDFGIADTLPRPIGLARAKELLLLDKCLDAEAAIAWGLVTEVSAKGGCEERALEVARRLAAGRRGTRSYPRGPWHQLRPRRSD